jgi:hypothetical protein
MILMSSLLDESGCIDEKDKEGLSPEVWELESLRNSCISKFLNS